MHSPRTCPLNTWASYLHPTASHKKNIIKKTSYVTDVRRQPRHQMSTQTCTGATLWGGQPPHCSSRRLPGVAMFPLLLRAWERGGVPPNAPGKTCCCCVGGDTPPLVLILPQRGIAVFRVCVWVWVRWAEAPDFCHRPPAHLSMCESQQSPWPPLALFPLLAQRAAQ